MNWSKGLLRAWLALSALYIGSILLIFWADGFDRLKPLWQSSLFEVQLKGGTERILDSAKPETELRRELMAAFLADQNTLAMRGRDAEAQEVRRTMNEKTDDLIGHVTQKSAEAHNRAVTALWVLLTPPVVLLVLGLIIVWVLRGFRPRRPG
jgi:hypothetical protein